MHVFFFSTSTHSFKFVILILFLFFLIAYSKAVKCCRGGRVVVVTVVEVVLVWHRFASKVELCKRFLMLLLCWVDVYPELDATPNHDIKKVLKFASKCYIC